MIDKKIYNLGKKLFKINRSITGAGTRLTLKYIKKELKNLKILKINSGKNVYDWTVPQEWNVNYAYVKDKFDNKIIDLKKNNLHLVGYSTPKSSYITKKNFYLICIQLKINQMPFLTLLVIIKNIGDFALLILKEKKLKKNIIKMINFL